MKIILQVFISIAFMYGVLHANEFADIRKISLKKDEQKKILVKYDNYVKEFRFRWTLYANDGLVIHRSYDKHVAQTILYLNGMNQYLKVYLKPKGSSFYEAPYILVKFKEFDLKQNQAVFELFLSDKESQIGMEYLKNK